MTGIYIGMSSRNKRLDQLLLLITPQEVGGLAGKLAPPNQAFGDYAFRLSLLTKTPVMEICPAGRPQAAHVFVIPL
jgi:hypothetical protein